ncbi:MAG: hypothetical protein JOZ78_13550 [Chroococcidiopsidaceae cyanobacterium CP_BM_ER_R8_30]|nr:hypothetical protein [Chroococcidiopsidaceae cyanobacterium CP_BM_ER_R8_30]
MSTLTWNTSYCAGLELSLTVPLYVYSQAGDRTKIELSSYIREIKMLEALEFKARIQNGLIRLPDEYKQEFREGDDIHVIVLI